MQNRRQFLKFLGTGLAVGSVASQLPIEQVLAFNPHRVYFDMGRTVIDMAPISQYSDYVTFSDILVETAIDPKVLATARELNYRSVKEIAKLLHRHNIKPYQGMYYGLPSPSDPLAYPRLEDLKDSSGVMVLQKQ